MFRCFDKQLNTLVQDPRLNSSHLVDQRLNQAISHNCRATDTYTFVPAAVGVSTRLTRISGSPEQLIRGGALPGSRFKHHTYDVQTVDFASWIDRFEEDNFVFVKMDIEGAEHGIVRRMDELGTFRKIDAIAFECHGPCRTTLATMRRWNITMIRENMYAGMDSFARKDLETKKCECGAP